MEKSLKRLGLMDCWPRGPKSWSRNEETNANIFLFSLLFYISPLDCCPHSQHSHVFIWVQFKGCHSPRDSLIPQQEESLIWTSTGLPVPLYGTEHFLTWMLVIFALHFFCLPLYYYKNNLRLSLSWINPCFPSPSLGALHGTLSKVGIPYLVIT